MISKVCLSKAFAVTATLSLSACGDTAPPDPRLIDPMSVRAVGMIRGDDGDLRCNHTMIGTNLSATSQHCLSLDRTFAVLDEDGNYIEAPMGNLAAPGMGWIRKVDAGAEPYMEDTQYTNVARDKAITLLTEDIGAYSGTMPIASLDSLDWQAVESAEGILQASVYLLTYRPTSKNENGYVFYREACHAYRLPDVNEVITHDCPTRTGVSGSPIVGEFNGEYALVAVHEGIATHDHDSLLVDAFAPAFPERKIIGFASVFGTMPALCETLTNCTADRDTAGHAVLALTN